jgi:4-hydroxy-tetrahydrodipicolinate reductase
VFFSPNFALGAVVMMQLSALAATTFPHAHIVEMHDGCKRYAPSGTAIATAAAMGTHPAISSVQLPGIVAHQEVIFAGAGEVLTSGTTP